MFKTSDLKMLPAEKIIQFWGQTQKANPQISAYHVCWHEIWYPCEVWAACLDHVVHQVSWISTSCIVCLLNSEPLWIWLLTAFWVLAMGGISFYQRFIGETIPPNREEINLCKHFLFPNHWNWRPDNSLPGEMCRLFQGSAVETTNELQWVSSQRQMCERSNKIWMHLQNLVWSLLSIN